MIIFVVINAKYDPSAEVAMVELLVEIFSVKIY